MNNSDWRLFAPAEDWQHPISIPESSLELLGQLGERLGLRVSRDDAQKKFYLGLPQADPVPKDSDLGVVYPSGRSIPFAKISAVEATRYGVTGAYTAAPLVAARVDDQVSQHFQAGEFLPHDSSYRYLRLSPRLVEILEKIRSGVGGLSVTVHSGYRPPAYNRQIGGASQSAHVDGLAADISVPGLSVARLHQVADLIVGETGGVGYYPDQGFVHVDVRGFLARWTG